MLRELPATNHQASGTDFMSHNDISLVSSAKNGCNAAFETLFERHKKMILFKALQVVNNREDAEDIVQQTFHNAFVHLQEFEGRSSFSTWLIRIALNQAFMLRRSSWRCRVISIDEPTKSEETATPLQIVDSRPGPESDCSLREREQMLYRAIKQLRPRMRSVVELRDLEERPARETARMLGISVTAVKSRVNRGRRMIRESLERQAAFKSRSFKPNVRPAA